MHLFGFVAHCVCRIRPKGWYRNSGGENPEVLDAMGDDDAVEELFKTDPLQEGLALPRHLGLSENVGLIFPMK